MWKDKMYEEIIVKKILMTNFCHQVQKYYR